MSKADPRKRQVGAMSLLEESFAILKDSSLSFGFYYTVGAIPFLLSLVYFIEDMGLGSVSASKTILASLGMSVLYVWMRTMHAFACESIRRSLLGEREPLFSFSKCFYLFFQQCRLLGGGFLFVLVSSILMAPFGWAICYYHALAACAYRSESAADCRREAWRTASKMVRVTHLYLVIHSVIFFVIWLNAGICFYFLPELFRMITGIENLMSVSGWNLFNTTFLSITLCVSVFFADALTKVFFTLLCFRRESITTGIDIISRFEALRVGKHLAVVSFMLGCLVLSFPLNANTVDGEPIASLETRAAQFDESAQKSLAKPEFAWRMDRLVEEGEGANEESDQDGVFSKIREMMKYLSDAVESFVEWLQGNDENKPARSPSGYSNFSGLGDSLLRILVIVGIIIVFALLLMFVFKLNRKDADAAPEPVGFDTINPDLREEEVFAADMPYDRWMALAQEKADMGEMRLAFRAVFLATLSLLGERKLVKLAKSKSNYEYETELRKRGLAMDTQSAFTEIRKLFDHIWYGSLEAKRSEFDKAVLIYSSLESGSRR